MQEADLSSPERFRSRTSAPFHPERPEQSVESHSKCEHKVKITDGDIVLSESQANVGNNWSTSKSQWYFTKNYDSPTQKRSLQSKFRSWCKDWLRGRPLFKCSRRPTSSRPWRRLWLRESYASESLSGSAFTAYFLTLLLWYLICLKIFKLNSRYIF